jgi:signal transduction histidine kinase
MTSAKQLLTARVVEGMADERLINVAVRLRARQAQHCVVLSAPGRFLGLVSLAEIASRSNAGQRILADLVSEIPPLLLGENDPAAAILDLFEKRGAREAIVLRADHSYVGLITAESLFDWMHSEQRAARQALEDIMAERLALSHDVRSPLRTIQGYADILASGEHGTLDPEGLGCAQSIKRSATRLELLADDILAKARRSSAAGSPPAEPVDLNIVLDDAVEFHRALFAERGAVLRKRGQLHPAAGRYTQVLQIVSNLIANAVSYGRPGRQPMVEVWTEDSENTIKLRIKDNGRGIAPAEALRLFTPFERGASTDQAGFGLGLAIAKRAADEAGARIALETADDEGSVFLVTFGRVPPAPSAQRRVWQ